MPVVRCAADFVRRDCMILGISWAADRGIDVASQFQGCPRQRWLVLLCSNSLTYSDQFDQHWQLVGRPNELRCPMISSSVMIYMSATRLKLIKAVISETVLDLPAEDFAIRSWDEKSFFISVLFCFLQNRSCVNCLSIAQWCGPGVGCTTERIEHSVSCQVHFYNRLQRLIT